MQKFAYLQSSLGRSKQAAPSLAWDLVLWQMTGQSNLAVRTHHRMNEEAERGRRDLRSGTVPSPRSEAAPRPCKAERVNAIPRRGSS